MTCETFQVMTINAAHNPAAQSNDEPAREHVASCPACAAFAAHQARLSDLLVSLRHSDQQFDASPQLEGNLLAEFRANWRPEPRAASLANFGWARFGWGLAAAIGLVVVAAIVRMQLPAPPPRIALDQSKVTLEVMEATKYQVSPAMPEAPRTSQVALDIANMQKMAARQAIPEALEEVATPVAAVALGETMRSSPASDQVISFIPLMPSNAAFYGESPVLMRIQMPVATLETLGVPVGPAPYQGLVQADVLVSSDGLPRAIRLVNQTTW